MSRPANVAAWAALWLALFAFAYYGQRLVRQHRPHGIRYNKVVWAIKFVPAEQIAPYIGLTVFDQHTIFIANEESCTDQQSTLLHELGHVAIDRGSDMVEGTFDGWMQGYAAPDTKPLDIGLQQIASENPEVWEWIANGCK